MTNPRRRSRGMSPEHRKSMKDIHLGIEKKNRLNRISKLRAKLAGDNFLDRDKDPYKRVIGRPGVNRAEKIQERKEDPDSPFSFSDNDIIAYDEEFAEGIPEPRVDGFVKNVERKIISTTSDGKYKTSDEPVNTQNPRLNVEPGTSGLSNTLEDRRVERKLLKDRGQEETFNETFTRKFGAPSLNKSPAGKEPKFNRFSQGVISRENAKRFGKMKQKLAGYGRPPQRVLDAFKAKKSEATASFVSDGKRLLFNGHEVARHTRKGIEVSYASHPTPMTASTIRGLGIDTRKVRGKTFINGKEVDPTKSDFTLVPTANISKQPFRVSAPKVGPVDKQMIDDQEIFRKKVRRRDTGDPTGMPEDITAIQPRDQKYINHLTGVKSPIPEPTMGTDAHHILPKSKFPGLRTNVNNGISLSNPNHVGEQGIHKLNNKLLGAKIAILKARFNVTEGMIQLAKNQSADSIMNAFGSYKRTNPDSLGSGVYDPVENRILDARIPLDAIRLQRLFEAGTNKIGFNSITDTRQSPATDVNLIRSQLKEIEQAGGIPALGFDEGSLEALDVVTNTTDDEILTSLRDSQRSTGILDADLTFRILDSPKFRRN